VFVRKGGASQKRLGNTDVHHLNALILFFCKTSNMIVTRALFASVVSGFKN